MAPVRITPIKRPPRKKATPKSSVLDWDNPEFVDACLQSVAEKNELTVSNELGESISCLERLMSQIFVEFPTPYTNVLKYIKKMTSHPYFVENPCELLKIVSEHMPSKEYGATLGGSHGWIFDTFVNYINPIVDNDTLVCQSKFIGEPIPSYDYAIELGLPMLMNFYKSDRPAVSSMEMLNRKCRSINSGAPVICWEKTFEIVGRSQAVYGNAGATEANFTLVNYIRNMPSNQRNLPNNIPWIIDAFVESPNDKVYTKWWKNTFTHIASNNYGYLFTTYGANGKSSFRNIITHLASLVPVYCSTGSQYGDGSECSHLTTHISTLAGIANALSDDDKQFVISDISGLLPPYISMGIITKWLGEKNPPSDNLKNNICGNLRENPEWLTALTATEIRTGQSITSPFQAAYTTCFNSVYPEPFEHTKTSRKYFDFLCLRENYMADQSLAHAITGVRGYDPESMNNASQTKPDEYGINGVYDIYLNETCDMDYVEKYVNDVWHVLFGSGGLNEITRYQQMTFNVGTRDSPVSAYVEFNIDPYPDIGYHDIYSVIDSVCEMGDFSIDIIYRKVIDNDRISKLTKSIKFKDIITDMPKNIRSKIMKDNPKLYNKLQGVANRMRNVPPLERGRYKMVISNKPADMARLTTCQKWCDKSCLNLGSGSMSAAIKAYADFGSYVAYLVKDNPYQPQWLARLIAHKCKVQDDSDKQINVLSIQDEKQHYTVAPKYWGVVHDAFAIVIADKGINAATTQGYCTDDYAAQGGFLWNVNNMVHAEEESFKDLCNYEIERLIREDPHRCVDYCINREKGTRKGAVLKKYCAEYCASKIRNSFGCTDWLVHHFIDDNHDYTSPFYFNYTDVSDIQHLAKGDSEYKKILKRRTSEINSSDMFVKKISDTV
jgi:hypothetical protein